MSARIPLYGLALVAGVHGFAPLADGDVFWNLNVGRWMWQHLSMLPAEDPFTYNAQPGGVQHEWLLQVLMASVDRALGLQGVRLAAAAAAAGAVLLCEQGMRARGVRAGWSVLAAALWWIVVEPHTVARPHLFAWLFALWVIGIRFSPTAPSDSKSLAVLFVACAVWANAHASVLVAPFYAAIAAVEAAVSAHVLRQPLTRAAPWLKRVVVCALASLCAPAGWRLFPYALSTPAVNKELSFEWWPLLRPDVWQSRPTVLVVWGLLLVALIGVGARAWKMRKIGPFPSLLAGAASLAHAAFTRRMTAFLFVALQATMSEFGEGRGRRWKSAAGVAPWAGLLLVLVLHGSACVAALRADPVAAGAFPYQSSVFMREVALQGRLFNPDGWGGYISYRVAGQKVFADGRWPLVGREVIHDGFAMMLRRDDEEPRFDKYQVDWAVFRLRDYLRVPGPDPRRWALVWQDGVAVILIRRGAMYEQNLRRVCAFYTRYDAPKRAQWPLQVKAPTGTNSPTAVPSALTGCVDLPADATRS